MNDGRARFRSLRWLTILGPTAFMVVAEVVRYFYLRRVLPPWQVSLVAVTVTMIAAGVFSTYVFAVVWKMEQERNGYRESMLALHERERLAREMHDGLAQDLAVLKLKVHRLQELFGVDDASDLATELGETRKIVERCYGEVRHNLYDLRAGHHLTGGLWKAISIQIDDFRRQTGLRVEWIKPPEVREPLDPRVSVQLLRIVQEALANVRKHAKADHVIIEADHHGGDLRLSIRDDGQGLDRATLNDGHHFGLMVMQERAQSVGARVTVTSGANGLGTVVEIAWPAAEGGEAHRKRKASVGG